MESALKQEWQVEPTQVWWVESALKQVWWVEPVPQRTPAAAVSVLEQVEVHSVVRQEWQVEPVPVPVRLAYLRTPAVAAVSVLEQEVPMAQWRVVQV